VRIAIDPAALTGIAYQETDQSPIRTRHGSLIEAAAIIDEILIDHSDRIDLTVEYPPCGLHGAPAVRFAANQLIQHIRRSKPRKMTITKLNPTVWISWLKRLYNNDQNKDSKTLSRRLCEDRKIDYKTQDEADAAAILLYVATHYKSKT
jgi:hypothetical protein